MNTETKNQIIEASQHLYDAFNSCYQCNDDLIQELEEVAKISWHAYVAVRKILGDDIAGEKH